MDVKAIVSTHHAAGYIGIVQRSLPKMQISGFLVPEILIGTEAQRSTVNNKQTKKQKQINICGD